MLVEILLAKKHTINYVLNKYIFNSRQAIKDNSHPESKDGQQGFTIINDKILDMIEQNARLSISLSDVILQLDSVRYLRYMSHKHMYHETSRRLRIDADEQQLKDITERVDKSLTNANNIADLKEANSTKNILLFISIASLFGVLLEGNGEAPDDFQRIWGIYGCRAGYYYFYRHIFQHENYDSGNYSLSSQKTW